MTAVNGGAGPRARQGQRWDVALSFAGAHRDYVQQVAEALRARGVSCFYDAGEQIELWGKYLAEELPGIYGEQAAAVVVFVSAEYAARDWTRHERRAALGRAVREPQEYVLPARFDDTPLPGLMADMVAVDLRNRPPEQFAAMVADKLAALGIIRPTPPPDAAGPAKDVGPAGAVRIGEDAKPVTVREVLPPSRSAEFPPDKQAAMLEQLIASGNPRDMPLIRQWWGLVVDDNPRAMLPVLVQTCRRLLWTPTPSSAIRNYLTLAADYNLLDNLLAELMTIPASRSDLKPGLEAVAQILSDWVVGAPDTTVYSATQAAMTSNPLVACELLAQLADSKQDSRAAVAWLQPVLGKFLSPFSVALGFVAGTVDRLAVGQLARYDIECVRALMSAASYGGHLDRVLPGFAHWLISSALEHGAHDPAASRYWRDLAWSLHGDRASLAWIDIALLASGDCPRFLLMKMSQEDRLNYNERTADAWSELTASLGQASDYLLMDVLIRYLDSTPWHAEESQAIAVVDLTARLTAGGRRPRLEAAIAERLSAWRS